MEKRFKDFLDNENIYFVDSPSFGLTEIIGVEYDGNLKLLYMGNMKELKAIEFMGIYDKDSGELYLSDSHKAWLLEQKQILSIEEVRTIDQAKEDIYNSLSHNISAFNSQNHDLLIDHSQDVPLSDRRIKEHFLTGDGHFDYITSYDFYRTVDGNDMLNYLADKTNFLDDYSKEYIKENYDKIKHSYNYNMKLNEETLKIENDLDHPAHKAKEIKSAMLLNPDCKTVNITIDKDGKDLTFKYEDAAAIRQWGKNGASDVSYYNISKKDRDLFEELYDDGSWGWKNIECTDVKKITYGKAVLYEDQNLKTKTLSSEIDKYTAKREKLIATKETTKERDELTR